MNKLFITAFLSATTLSSFSQKKIEYVEYDLPNGIHVILHEEHATPIVAVSILYHVGSKNEKADRTGFAHFFEHLLFEGSENIKRGEYSALVEKNGGALNANTSKLVRSVQSFKYDPCMFPMLQDDKEIPVTTMLLELYPEFENSLAI